MSEYNSIRVEVVNGQFCWVRLKHDMTGKVELFDTQQTFFFIMFTNKQHKILKNVFASGVESLFDYFCLCC